MCGITATYSAHPAVPLDADTLENQLRASIQLLNHRGPDSSGIYISDDWRIGLGHSRLSIIDVEGGQQPLHDLEYKVHVVVNGELYDYVRLRQELEAKGAIFQTNSDSELVVHLYNVHGLNLVHHLRGEFAFVLYDSVRKRLFAARDRFGIKPLFYTLVNDEHGHQRLLLASEMKAFMAFGWQAEWDVQSLLEGGEYHDNRTVFKRVHKIPAGHQLLYSCMGNLKIQPYWDQNYIHSKATESRAVEEIVQGVRERLVDAVRVRLRSDVPLAIALSGGVDSAGIAGIATAILREQDPNAKVTTFTLAFPARKDLDEGPIASRMAEHIGADIQMITPSEADLVGKFEEVIIHSEMAVHTLHSSGKFILSEHIRKAGYKVVLTGEGADEVHGGYAYLLADYLRAPDPTGASMGLDLPNPSELVSIVKIVEGTRPSQDHIPIIPMSYSDHQKGRSIVGGISTPRVWAMLAVPSTLFVDEAVEMYKFDDTTTTVAENMKPEVRRNMVNGNWHPLNSALYVSGNAMLPVLLNQLGDRAEMCSSVEGRQPYLDTELVEYMNGAPPSLKVRPFKDENGQWKFREKWLLREAVKPFITEEIYYRKKEQYNSPATRRPGEDTDETYSPLQALIHRRVTKENVERLGFLDWDRINELLEAYLKQPDLPIDGGIDKRARALLVVTAYVILQELFKVPTTVY